MNIEPLKFFVRRDFVATYKQTILGLPPFLFSMAGTVIWSYFAACLTKTSATFTANAGLFGKVMDTI